MPLTLCGCLDLMETDSNAFSEFQTSIVSDQLWYKPNSKGESRFYHHHNRYAGPPSQPLLCPLCLSCWPVALTRERSCLITLRGNAYRSSFLYTTDAHFSKHTH